MRILFYDDSAIFGGHEVMTLHAVEYLLQHTQETVIFVLSEANGRLKERMEQMQARCTRLTIHQLPFHSASFQGIRTFVSPRQIATVSRLLCSHTPDVVLLVQGGIEISSIGLLAARRAGLPTISYIPFGHSVHLMGGALGSVRDLLNRRLYRCPDRYITITDSMVDSLYAHGVTAPISVVYNCIDSQRYPREERACARERLNLPANIWILGIIGRITFRHKGHDFLLQSLAKHRDRLKPWRLLVVGDGPDLPALHKLIASLDLHKEVICLPWSPNMSDIYSALDAVTLPSHFEGMPLVMLEAMLYELPVVASDRDGMKDILPVEWRFRVGDAQALINTLAHVQQCTSSALTVRLKAQVEDQFTPYLFGAAFYQTIQNGTPAAY